MDLTGISPLDPQDTELVSKGAGRIRDTREGIIESFGGVGNNGTGGTHPEHRLNGAHQFPNGAIASIPAAGNLGRIFIDTADGGLAFDNGNAWQFLHTTPIATNFVAGPIVLNTTFQLTNVLTITAVEPATLIVLFNFGMAITTADGIQAQITVDGNLGITPAGCLWAQAANTSMNTRGTIISAQAVTQGSHGVAVAIKNSFALASPQVSGLNLIAVLV